MIASSIGQRHPPKWGADMGCRVTFQYKGRTRRKRLRMSSALSLGSAGKVHTATPGLMWEETPGRPHDLVQRRLRLGGGPPPFTVPSVGRPVRRANELGHAFDGRFYRSACLEG